MNLFDAVLKGASVRRLGDLTLVNLGAHGGSLLLESRDFQSSRKWALQKQASGNAGRDFQMLLSRLECLVSRYGTGIPAKGSPAQLLRLAEAMHGLGYHHEDWNFPRAVADELRKAPKHDQAVAGRGRHGAGSHSVDRGR
ncbi:MAG: hypothetical protein L0H83_05880 [Salinisphaera sp.]|nr:hypothetical protein [Salinisphaera sp.]